MNNEPLEREPMNNEPLNASQSTVCGLAWKRYSRQTPLRDVAPALNGRASLAGVRPCRTGARAGGNTCGPQSARLDLKAAAVPRPDTDHTGPSISSASMPMARSRGLWARIGQTGVVGRA